ncbi:receptor-like protein 35 [Capsicum annuum]|uniref:receptor-like protein 35 n=1 Tax=Capsicum annuum TaxID=4072 RepID=UPI001FB10D2C|nr:receptor-like protein 35 [Capsicum annuum]
MVGTLPPKIGNLKAVTKMDLWMNQFSTEIPREIGGLQNLAYLSLRHNKFQGAIPDSMSNMVGLEFLDLSHNNISGIIPMSLEKLQYLKSFGSVYKGVLRSRTAIAVKVFTLQLEAAYKSFDMECEVLRSLCHRNLIKVIISCSNHDFKALVLEYIPYGSLENNVLLYEDMGSHLSDFGMSKLLGEDQGDLYTKTIATLGYIAPEYGLDGLVSTKCDKELDVVASIVKIALDCCAESPAKRANMKDVVGMLQKIKIQLLAC